MHAKGTEGMEETVQFYLRLRVSRLTLIPGDGTKASRSTLTIYAVLRQDPSHTARRRVDAYIDGAFRRIVNRNKGGGMENGVLESFHGVIVLLCPEEGLPFAGKIDQRSGESRIVLDPDAHEACGA